MEFEHKPVLLEECIEFLNIRPDGIYVDGTLGGGGHSSEIIRNLGSDGVFIELTRIKMRLKRLKEVFKP